MQNGFHFASIPLVSRFSNLAALLPSRLRLPCAPAIVRAARTTMVERCEPRLMFNAGGGWVTETMASVAGDGIYGQYFNNASMTGSPTFTRFDVRVDFPGGTTANPGGGLTASDVGSNGSADPAFGAIATASNWSVEWDGEVMPKYTEVYTLKEMIGSGDTGKVYFGTGAQGTNPLILSGSGTQTTAVTMTAGTAYNLEMTYVHNGGSTWQAQLHWSSSGSNAFAEEAIETATPVGANLPSPESMDAPGFGESNLDGQYYMAAAGNITAGGSVVTNVDDISSLAVGDTIQDQFMPGIPHITSINDAGDSFVLSETAYNTVTQAGLAITSVSTGPPQDSNGWPENDFFLQQFAGVGPEQSNGIYTITFKGAAALFDNGPTIVDFLSGNSMAGLSSTTVTTSTGTHTYYEYPSEISLAEMLYNSATGTGYNPANNTTTILMNIPSGANDNVGFAATSRNGYGASGSTATTSTGAGITNLMIEAPNSQDGSIDYAPGTIFATPYLQVFSSYSVIRSNWTAWETDQPDANNYDDWAYRPTPSLLDFKANPNAAESGTGFAPWEEEILLSNETGKDIYLNIPPTVTGMDPAYDPNVTSSYIYQLAELLKNGDTVNGVTWPGLLPNLNVYIEYGNEIWNPGTGPQSNTLVNFQAAFNNNTTDYQDYMAAGGNTSIQEPVNLSSYYNETGIYSSGTTFSPTAGLDGNGNALSWSVINGRDWYAFLIGASNTTDMVSGAGQTIATTNGEYSTLSVYGMGTNGDQTDQQFVVNYTNGSHATFAQTVSNWFNSLTPYNISADLTSASATLSSVSSINTLFVGEILTGAGIPAGTSISSLSTSADTVVLSSAVTASAPSGEGLVADPYTGKVTNGSSIVSNVSETLGMFVGETITGTNIPTGTTIMAIGANSITLSANATATSATPEPLGDGEKISQAYTSYATSTGATANGDNYLYQYVFSLNPTLTISSVTIPNNSNLEIFAMNLLAYESPASESPGDIIQFNYNDWEVLRLKDISAIFRAVYGNSVMPSTSNGVVNADPRIRPLYEWQYADGQAGDEMTSMDTEFSLNANYYLYGGGGGWYAGDGDTASTAAQLFADLPALETSKLNITQEILSNALTLQQFGLHDVAYEGGFYFGIGSFASLSTAASSAMTSPSMTTAVTETLDEFEQATAGVGGLPIVYEGINDESTTDGWAVIDNIYDQAQYGQTTEKLQGYLNAEATLAPSALPSGWSGTVVGGASYTSPYNYGVADGPTTPGTGIWTIASNNPNNTGFDSNNNHTSDKYYAVTTTVSGNVTETAELTSDTNNNYADTGLAMRTSNTDSTAPVVALVADPSDGGFAMSWRTTEGGSMVARQDINTTLTPPNSSGTPVWLRLTESGDVFTGYISSGGVTWTTVGSVTLSPSNFSTSSFQAGLEQDSNGSADGGRDYATFQNVSVNQFADAFNYTSGTTLSGASGGTGWLGNWAVASGDQDGTITSGGLSVPSPSSLLMPTPSGNAVEIAGNGGYRAGDFRQFASTSSPISTGTLYVSFLMERNDTNARDTALSLFSGGPTGTEELGLGVGYNSTYNPNGNLGLYWNSGSNFANSTIVSAADTTYLIVAAITFNGSSSTVQMYIDPAGTSQPLTPSASATVSGLSAGVDTVRIYSGGTGYTGTSTIFDEVKIGSTYQEVI